MRSVNKHISVSLICILSIFLNVSSIFFTNNKSIDNTISSEKIESLLSDVHSNPSNSSFGDLTYSIPTKKWIDGEISINFEKFIDRMGMRKYSPDRNDCDDYARAFTLFCKVEYKRYNRDKKFSPAVGEFYYVKDFSKTNNRAHAINFIVELDDVGNLKLSFYDPQLMKKVKLTEDEIRSCFFYGM